MSFLTKIVKEKKSEVKELKKVFPLNSFKSSLRKSKRDFKSAISLGGIDRINIIAEIKKASPSEGIIRKDFDHITIAEIYEQSGISAISVITEKKFFQGDISFLQDVKNSTAKPILRKDFIIDEYQIYESRLYGADAILLIAAILDVQKIKRFIEIAGEYNMACIVEVHNQDEIDIALNAGAEIIGINNRDLKTFGIDKTTVEKLTRLIPKDKIIIAESGYDSREEIFSLKGKVNSVLIGSSIMKAKDIREKLREIMEGMK